jgi:type IV pilus assembly protein PilX
MPMNIILDTPKCREGGFVLLVSLMLLVVLTILGISIISTNTLDERMAGYFMDRQIALQAAEAALRDAERDLLYSGRISGTLGFANDCSNEGLCLPESDGTPIWADLESTGNLGWLQGNNVGPSIALGTYSSPPAGLSTIPNVAAQPRYIIEALTIIGAGGSLKIGFGAQQSSILYRVTAVGFGRRATTRVVLQALFRP